MKEPLLLTTSPQITLFDNTRWVVQCPSGHQLLVNTATADLLGLLVEAPTIEQGRVAFNARFAASMTQTEFEQLVQKQFGGYQLLRHDRAAIRPLPNSPIQWRLELLPARWVGILAAPLTALYTPMLFWPVLILATISILAIAISLPSPILIPTSGWILAICYASVPIHELGHIAACRRAGVAHGGIGAGFYFCLPLLYADVTCIWQANRQQRVIANLGGIYSQLLYAVILVCIGLLFRNQDLMIAAVAVSISAAWQLNPFLRHDGYWLLSDLTNTPNLLAKSQFLQRRLFSLAGLREVLRRSPRTLITERRLWLFIYGIMHSVLIVSLISYMIWHNGASLLSFPHQAKMFGLKLLRGSLTRSDLSFHYLTILAFYGWLLRWGMLRLLRWWQPRLVAATY